LWISALPFSISAISSLMEISASQNLSNSACKGYRTTGTQYVRKGEEEQHEMKKGEESTTNLTLLSLSVGSIISVPGTGHDIVGA